MGKLKSTLLQWASSAGFEPYRTRAALKNVGAFFREYRTFVKESSELRSDWPIELRPGSFNDRNDAGGVASGHYFHQDLLVAKRIFERQPGRHVDVGSRIDGFVAHVAVFREIEVFDIRSITSNVENITFRRADLTDLDPQYSGYCDSVSCLHALEHFGLGRYGDPIDSAGHVHGLDKLYEMLKPHGILYLSLPIGRERVEFNNQRVFSLSRVESMYTPKFDLMEFSYVDDNGDLHESVRFDELSRSSNLEYGCGIFELKKKTL